MPSIKKNFLYSSTLTVANYLFPIITFPYVSRVLGVNNIGACAFVDGIINYYILFSMMGVTILGIREIAKNKNDRKSLSKTFSSIFLLNTLLTCIAIIVLLISIFTVPKLFEYKTLMLVGIFKLLFNFLLIEWLYKGIENFRYITIRTLIIKVLYVIAVFTFVHNKSDYIIYYILSVLMIVVNAVFNIVYSRHFIKFQIHNLNIKEYIRPVFVLGFYQMLTSMYTTFNVAYLGFVSSSTEVGYYTTATKLYSILMAIFTAFTGVMLPRMSFYVSNGQMDKFKTLLKKSQNALISFSFPIIIYSTVWSPDIINVLSGEGYEGAITPMRIVMPLMFIIGYEQILVIQTLMPLKQDRAILINSVFGAVTGVVLNIVLVKAFLSIGSAMVWICSETVILVASLYRVKKSIGWEFPFKEITKHIIGYLPLLAIAYFVFTFMDTSSLFRLIIGAILLFGYTVIYQYQIKNELFMGLVAKLTHKRHA